jgi:hypothetical protein
LAASVRLVFAFPEAAPNAWANLALRPRSFAQFFVLANVGAAAVVVVAPVVVVAAEVVGVAAAGVVDADDFFPPPQPAAITTKATTKMDTSLSLIADTIV